VGGLGYIRGVTDPRPAETPSEHAPEPARGPIEPAPGPIEPAPGPIEPAPAPLGAAAGTVRYRGQPLDPERGPGLGCFRFQLVVLAILIVLTPLSVAWQWPFEVSAVLLFATLILLLIAGQTIIFLLRLVAADRRAAGRRRPLASASKTVGELEDEGAPAEPDASPEANPVDPAPPAGSEQSRSGPGGVRE
jgi:hypothetical protein